MTEVIIYAVGYMIIGLMLACFGVPESIAIPTVIIVAAIGASK